MKDRKNYDYLYQIDFFSKLKETSPNVVSHVTTMSLAHALMRYMMMTMTYIY